MTPNEFDASASALGYIFQVRFALLAALRKMRAEPRFDIVLETLDDVAFQAEGNPTELFQTKHHVKSMADLSDYSKELWGTIRIWSENFKLGALRDETALYLITNSVAAAGSVAAHLRKDVRNESVARSELEKIAISSTSAQNKKAYDAFMGLTSGDRARLVKQIIVVDQFPGIQQIDQELLVELAYVASRDHLPVFVQRLEGWWFGRVITHLVATNREPILADELETKIADLREQFKIDSLPIDPEIATADVDVTSYKDRKFVAQLRLISVSQERLKHAIFDYFKAYEQRSRWLREELICVGEVTQYEKKLVDEWERQFAKMKERLGDRAAETRKKQEGRQLYNWAEEVLFHIRPRCTEAFISRGSFQMLADKISIGWHADFQAKLRTILTGKEAA